MDLLKEIKDVLTPDAEEFILKWTDYVHLIDDMQDGDAPVDVLRVTAKAAQVYSTRFYREHAPFLEAVVILTNNTYGDSFQWEISDTKWKKIHAGVLRHTGYDMFFAVVYLLAGYEKMRELSLRFREYSHTKHLKDETFYSKDFEEPAEKV